MARSERIRTMCPKCGWKGLRVVAGGPCGNRAVHMVVPFDENRDIEVNSCGGTVEAVPPNAPRDPYGRKRVRMSVNLQPETAEALTATQVAALADGHVAGSARELTDRQQQLLVEVQRARGGVKRIANGRQWRDYVAEELDRMGLITCVIVGHKRFLRAVKDGSQ